MAVKIDQLQKIIDRRNRLENDLSILSWTVNSINTTYDDMYTDSFGDDTGINKLTSIYSYTAPTNNSPGYVGPQQSSSGANTISYSSVTDVIIPNLSGGQIAAWNPATAGTSSSIGNFVILSDATLGAIDLESGCCIIFSDGTTATIVTITGNGSGSSSVVLDQSMPYKTIISIISAKYTNNLITETSLGTYNPLSYVIAIGNITKTISTNNWNHVTGININQSCPGTSSIFHFVSFDRGTSWMVFNGGNWRTVATSISGQWQYNVSSTATPAYSSLNWVTNTNSSEVLKYTAEAACLKLAATITQNQMTATQMMAITDSQWINQINLNPMGTLDFAIAMKADSSNNVPSFSGYVLYTTSQFANLNLITNSWTSSQINPTSSYCVLSVSCNQIIDLTSDIKIYITTNGSDWEQFNNLCFLSSHGNELHVRGDTSLTLRNTDSIALNIKTFNNKIIIINSLSIGLRYTLVTTTTTVSTTTGTTGTTGSTTTGTTITTTTGTTGTTGTTTGTTGTTTVTISTTTGTTGTTTTSVYVPKTYYVDGTIGLDTNDGSQYSPFKTVARANWSVLAGDTVFIVQGVYNETFSGGASGTASLPITFQGVNRDVVILRGASTVKNWVQHGNYWSYTGLIPMNVGSAFVMVDSSSYLTLSTDPDLDNLQPGYFYVDNESPCTYSIRLSDDSNPNTSHNVDCYVYNCLTYPGDNSDWGIDPRRYIIFKDLTIDKYLFGVYCDNTTTSTNTNWTFDNVKFSNNSNNGIYAALDNWTIQNCIFDKNNASAIVIYGTGVNVHNNKITNTNWNIDNNLWIVSCIEVGPGTNANNCNITNNIIDRSGLDSTFSYGILIRANVSNCVIEGNFISNINCVGIGLIGCNNCRVINNVVYNFTTPNNYGGNGGAFVINNDANNGSVQAVGNLIAFNTAYNVTSPIGIGEVTTPITPLNIIVNNCFSTYNDMSGTPSTTIATINNNCWYNGITSWGVVTLDQNPITSNPLLTSNSWYLPQVGSPLLNAAIATIPTISNDIRGISRPQNGTSDIGAYERQTSEPATTTTITTTYTTTTTVTTTTTAG